MPERDVDTEAIMSWALAFAVLVGVTMCLRVITLEVNAHTMAYAGQHAAVIDVARR